MAIPSGIGSISGGLILPAGIPAPTLVRRDLSKRYPHLKRRLLDPQLYLSALPSVTCRSACVNLASYGWFLTDGIKPFESAKQEQAEWKREAKAKIYKSWKGTLPTADADISGVIEKCVGLQASLGCEAVILPSPLTTEFGSDYSVELSWLDRGMAIASKLAPATPRLATIALSDTCLRGIEPWKNDILTIILDQVTARAPDGAYLVIEQSNENGYYCAHPNTIGSLLRLVYELKQTGVQRIVLGLTGIAGLLGLAVGADTWAAGWYRGERRVRLADFDDQMGMAVPTYYSHKLAGEIHLENDLDRLNMRGLVTVLEDLTPASNGLLRALRAGRKVATVPEWQYRRSNVAAASEHFFTVAGRETEQLSSKTPKECLRYALDWLTGAEKLASDLYAVGGFATRTELNHQASWLQAYQKFLSITNAL